MKLIETLEYINYWLDKFYGKSDTNQVTWRVVFSEDQLEKRFGTYNDFTREGIFLRTVTEVREVPKYRQWIKAKYILERLTPVPFMNMEELPDCKLSYEPFWVFEDNKGNYLPPRLDACKFIIDELLGRRNVVREKDPDTEPEAAKYNQEVRVQKIQEELFGNETDTTDAIAHKQAIIVPRNYEG